MLTTLQRFSIEPSHRALLVGRTGSGKSTLARALLIPLSNVFVIDPKGQFHLPNERIVRKPEGLNRLSVGDPRPVLFQPDVEYDEYEVYDALFHWIYQRRNTTVYIDELFAVFKAHQPNRWLRACLTRGRSYNIRTFAATQRPFSIPLEILSESEHRFMFNLQMHNDKRRMAELMGDRVMQPLGGPHNFYYYNVLDPDAGVTEMLLKPRKGNDKT
jgi:DNA helicase HerA-like ATPase